jgi:hypothetical protein
MQTDGPRKRLIELLDATAESLSSVSLAIGKNKAYLQQFLDRGSPRVLNEETREALAAHFNVSPDEFRPRPRQAGEVNFLDRDLLREAIIATRTAFIEAGVSGVAPEREADAVLKAYDRLVKNAALRSGGG